MLLALHVRLNIYDDDWCPCDIDLCLADHPRTKNNVSSCFDLSLHHPNVCQV